MLSTLKSAWKIPDLRKKIIFTLMMLLVFRLGSSIPVPGMKEEVIKEMFSGQAGGLLDFINLMAGGAFKNFTIFALNIYPYITASISSISHDEKFKRYFFFKNHPHLQ